VHKDTGIGLQEYSSNKEKQKSVIDTAKQKKRTEIETQTLVSSVRIGFDEMQRIETGGKGIAARQAFLVAAVNVGCGKARRTNGAKSHARTERIQGHAASKDFVRCATSVHAQRWLCFWIPTATNLATIISIGIGNNGGPLMPMLLMLRTSRHDGLERS
jgi:hypothetical protein